MEMLLFSFANDGDYPFNRKILACAAVGKLI
jgi:hypothetical protein